ncbi:MAG: asparaginase [Chloroflexi bacterium]|nr:asparaginase [Chloroflexota bacterium]
MSGAYLPVLEATRNDTVESLHYGAAAVVTSAGRLLAWYGDAQAVTFMRSSAKPFQSLPFVEAGGVGHYRLTQAELALICASHSGTDEHVAAAHSIQVKAGVAESELLCGAHPLSHAPTIEAMRQRGESLSPNRNNCSGKHTGMLAYARMAGWPAGNYLDCDHPLQKTILRAFAEMCQLDEDKVALGVDGCSAPNFAVPLHHAALGYARLCAPREAGLPPQRAAACEEIVAAMTARPEMVGGPDSFDTLLMTVTRGRILSKGGAEGYHCLGLRPGALAPGAPGVGVALKISDGDLKGRASPAVTLEVLSQLGALSPAEMRALAKYGPTLTLSNWRMIPVGQARPVFTLSR